MQSVKSSQVDYVTQVKFLSGCLFRRHFVEVVSGLEGSLRRPRCAVGTRTMVSLLRNPRDVSRAGAEGGETSCGTGSGRTTITPDVSSLTVKKVMRVATVFTGAAACTAFLAPAANAETEATLTPGATARPASTTQRSCNNAHYFHIKANTESYCFGGAGSAYPDYPASAFCGGNNYGFFSGWSYKSDMYFGKSYRNQHFRPGSKYYSFIYAGNFNDRPLYMSFLHISGWDGTGPQNKACSAG
jgi:hypothetical protein